MENQVQLFNHPEFGGVRVVGDNENPRFCLSDVCKILAIGNPSDVKKRLDKGVVSIETLQTAGGMQSLTFINEDGLYDVILDSRKPSAKKFRKWITNQVIPSIRKTGMYMTVQTAENILLNPDFIIKLAEQVKAAHKERDEYKALAAAKDETINQLKPDATYCREVLQAPNTMAITVIAKEYGMSGKALNKILCDEKIQRPMSGTYVLNSPYDKMGYAELETVPTPNGSRRQLKWYEKGRHMIHTLLAKKYPTNKARLAATQSLFE